MTLGGGIVTRALDDLTIEHFQPLIGQTFRVAYPDFVERLMLVEATAARAAPPPRMRHGFSLFFEGDSRDRWLPQGRHPLEHATFGRLDLFIVPLGPGPNGRFRYEAAFS
jgi:hypothetical protein